MGTTQLFLYNKKQNPGVSKRFYCANRAVFLPKSR
ncbi:hypothetical protein TcasGA2_TC031273 [Tribolium castaneum]|uniref:Uncharacterized protein n=1 Tax=Tribolium castaneum TaxID=7070 RepID=A0A139WE69_TRICA|nr:hypothetical protein TcasGA2_TC031273 [Tribolium castaneum]